MTISDPGFDDQRALIAHVRSALALKTLPLAARHTGMDAGSGSPCTVCELRIEPQDRECAIGSWGRVHLTCYLIWTAETRQILDSAGESERA